MLTRNAGGFGSSNTPTNLHIRQHVSGAVQWGHNIGICLANTPRTPQVRSCVCHKRHFGTIKSIPTNIRQKDSNPTSLSEKPVCRSVRRGFGSDQGSDSPTASKRDLLAAETVPSQSDHIEVKPMMETVHSCTGNIVWRQTTSHQPM